MTSAVSVELSASQFLIAHALRANESETRWKKKSRTLGLSGAWVQRAGCISGTAKPFTSRWFLRRVHMDAISA